MAPKAINFGRLATGTVSVAGERGLIDPA